MFTPLFLWPGIKRMLAGFFLSNFNLLTKISIPIFCLFLFLQPVQAQVTEEWAKRYNNSLINRDDVATAITTDLQGNIYVTGYSRGSTSIVDYATDDYATIKYDAQGNQLWVKRYNGPENGDDQAIAIAIDAQGNVYVTGTSYGGGGGSPSDYNYNDDYATIKYDTNGNQLWVKRYTGSANYGQDRASAMVIDLQGNIVVTGNSVTVKYDTQGNELWVKPHGLSRRDPIDLAVDTQGNVYIAGSSSGFKTIKYDTQGNELWAKVYTYKNSGIADAIAVDKQGNVYVTGTSEHYPPPYYDVTLSFSTVKYDSQGNQLWAKQKIGAVDDFDAIKTAEDIAVDDQGNVYVIGRSFTIKYNTQGTELWVKHSSEIITSSGEKLTSLSLGGNGNVYATGGGGTVAYNPQGDELWTKTYDGYATIVVIDQQDNIYVTGVSEGNGTYNDYLTIKYTQDAFLCTATGSILREYWSNVQGSAVSTIPVNTTPISSTQLTSFETTTNAGNNYGQRIRGYLCAPVSGNYTFYIAGDDNAELWLSTDEDPAKKTKIAAVNYFTGVKEWTKYASQKSVSIPLVAGKKYYIEALHKESLYGDNLAVAWILPNTSAIAVIAGSYLSPYVAQNTGKISKEVWTNVQGSTVSTIPLNTMPTSTGELTSFETPSNAGNNYGQRIRGYLHPVISGNYIFYIAGDDNAELWLSTDEDPAKKVRIASINYFTGVKEWTKYTSQKSVSIPLVAGKKYYIEALHKESLYSDHLAVAWTLPGSSSITVIAGSYLSPFTTSNPVARVGQGEEWQAVNSVSLHPNPFENQLSLQTSLQGKLLISVTDNLGRSVYQATHQVEARELEIDLSKANLKAGLYFVSIQTREGQTKVIRVVKK